MLTWCEKSKIMSNKYDYRVKEEKNDAFRSGVVDSGHNRSLFIPRGKDPSTHLRCRFSMHK